MVGSKLQLEFMGRGFLSTQRFSFVVCGLWFSCGCVVSSGVCAAADPYGWTGFRILVGCAALDRFEFHLILFISFVYFLCLFVRVPTHRSSVAAGCGWFAGFARGFVFFCRRFSAASTAAAAAAGEAADSVGR